MTIIYLTSICPAESEGTAGNTTLFELLKQNLMLKQNSILLIYLNNIPCNKNIFLRSEKELNKFGTIKFKNFSHLLDSSKCVKKKFNYLSKLFAPDNKVLDYYFDKSEIIKTINDSNPKKIIFFWDTILEFIAPHLSDYITIYYGAKPPFAAFKDSIEKRRITLKNVLNVIVDRILLKRKEKIHYKNIQSIKTIYNISHLDVKLYKQNKINCEYLPNTTKDKFRLNWKKNIKFKNKYPTLLGSISNLNATGNNQAITFLNDKLFYEIKKKNLDKKFKILITGKGKLNSNMNNIKNSNIFEILGFVEDLEQTICSSDIVLMLNNFGSYTGGYTRVINFFSAAKCMIASKNLHKDMPEVRHNYNCLLANNSEEVVAFINNLLKDNALRERICRNARKTFEEKYISKRIVEKLINGKYDS